MTGAVIIFAIVLYMASVIYVGMRLSSQNKSTDDFYLGGRRLGPLVTAMSAEASDMSSWLLMGLPGVALAGLVAGNGTFAESVWTAIGLAIGTYLNWIIVAKRLRIYSEKIDANTIPDFFSNRYGDKSGALLALSAVIIIVYFVPYTASGFAAVGKLFNSLFNLDYHASMVVGAAVIAIYTILGGFLAASTTDFIQGVIMSIAMLVVFFYGVSTAGGMDTIMANTSVVKNYFSLSGPDGSYGFLPVASTLAWGLGYFGMPHILLRFMAIEDRKKLTLARRVACIWVVISMALAIFIGVMGYSFAKTEGILGGNFDPERIIVYIASSLSKNNLFCAFGAGVIISGILASIMSTSDSQMLAAASSVSENIFRRFWFKNMSEKAQMIFARLTVFLITIIGIVFAWNSNSSVFRIVSFAWAGFGAAFGPLMLFSLFWKRTTKSGALAGVVVGGVMVFVWKFGVAKLGGLFSIYELLPAFLLSSLAIVIFSLASKAPDKEIVDAFEAVNAEMKK